MLWLRERADLVEIEDEFFDLGVTADPDDDYLIAFSISAAAGVLVSGDQHLLDVTTAASVITPSEFLGQM